MSTTEHVPTMEQELNKIKQELPVQLERFCKEAREKLPLTSYDMTFSLDTITPMIAGATMGLPHMEEAWSGYNSIKFQTCQKLSEKFRWRMNKTFDAYRRFSPVLFPGEEVETATLYNLCVFPKDPAVLEKHLRNKELTPEESQFYFKDKLQEKFYVPVKTLKNPGDSFSFFGVSPLPVCGLPYNDFSVEITLRNSQGSPIDRVMLVETFWYFPELRKKICKLYSKVFMGKDISLEDSPEEVEKSQVLSDVRKCPECREPAVIICNCINRDSKCSNGHKWHYDRKKNKILPGHTH